MREVSGPVIGIALVLSAVFIPTAFLPGITGRLYQQFALTIAISVIFSAFNALSLSPALSALLLRPAKENARSARLVLRSIQSRLRQRNARLRELVAPRHSKSGAQFRAARRARGRRGTVWIAIAERLFAGRRSGLHFSRAAIAGRIVARANRSGRVRKIEDILSKTPGVQYTTSVIGFSLLSLVQNTYSAFFFVTFKPWSERTKPEEQYAAIKANINKQLAGLTEGIAFAFPPPAIPGVGTSGGFQFILEDRAGKDVAFLAQNREDVSGRGAQTAGARHAYSDVSAERSAGFRQRRSRQSASSRESISAQVYQTLQTFMGGFFVNYFNRFGRTWQVYIEAEGDYRTDAKNVGQFFVRNANGDSSPARCDLDHQEHRRSGIHVALQRISLGPNQRLGRARL